jgi:3-oxoacyl-[acyl-carrier protein] reductase
MDLGIAGEAALVLGGTQGLTFSAAKHLSDAGVKLVVNGRSRENGEAAVAALGGDAVFVAGDVSDLDGLAGIHARAVEAVGPVAILVNNAGGPPPGQFMDHDRATWQKAFETNLLAAVAMTKLVLPAMIARGWGRILNVTSFAVREPYPNLVLANSVRAGLHGAMSTLAREVAEKGITVNNVLPGLMDTGALQRVYKAQSAREGITEDAAKARMAESVPAKRLGEAEDFGPVCAFLCSRHAAYITAQNVTVDGGLVRALL